MHEQLPEKLPFAGLLFTTLKSIMEQFKSSGLESIKSLKRLNLKITGCWMMGTSLKQEATLILCDETVNKPSEVLGEGVYSILSNMRDAQSL